MNTKSLVGLVLGATFFVVGSSQADNCFRDQPGWHMVPKSCNIKSADNWQSYTSGVYIQPVVDKDLFSLNKLMN